ncbi:YdcH family protein [Arcobacter sp.]|uniref:YdcH family protein n=1 Tax=Arcobacter sp. TaxID=1872629 RepID=UPI003D12D6F6
MLHEYREEIAKLKASDNYFHNIFEKHNALDDEIEKLEKAHADQFEIEAKKKEKLKLKDEVYNAIIKYKKDNNL